MDQNEIFKSPITSSYRVFLTEKTGGLLKIEFQIHETCILYYKTLIL